MNPRERYIRLRAAKVGLDPRAVVADSLGEGAAALHGGNSVGDHGTSFGPFQLHAGGALPASVWAKGAKYANAWANSREGIDYALRQMVADGAGGLQGHDAVAAIVSKFERPADIPGQIAARWGYYGQVGGKVPAGGGSALPGIPPAGGMGQSAASPLTSQAVRSMAAASLLQQSAATVGGAPSDPMSLMALALARRQADAAQQTYGPQPTQGSLLAPPGRKTPMPPQVGGGVPFLGDVQGVKPHFLRSLSAAVAAIGGTKVRVNSGYRSPQHNAAVGGAPHSNHMTGDAIDGDAYIPGHGWVPLGTALAQAAPKYGLRSGATFNWGGKPDVVHVDDGLNQR